MCAVLQVGAGMRSYSLAVLMICMVGRSTLACVYLKKRDSKFRIWLEACREVLWG